MIKYLYKNVDSKSVTEQKTYKAGSWVYVEDPDGDELNKLVKKFKLDKGLITDAIDEDEMPRMEREGEYTYIFTRFAYRNDDLQITTAPLLLAVNEKSLITISPKALPRLENFISGKVDFTTTQHTKLVLLILDQIVEQYEDFLNVVSRQIKAIRSRLRVEQIRNQDFIDFVLIEDELNEFLSALSPTNSILRRILLGKHVKLYEDDEEIVEDLLLNNQQSIEGCRANLKTIVNIREAYSTIMTNNLNRVIRLLTVVTVVLAVPTLIASIYGMNVDLPFDRSSFAFGGVMVFSLSISIMLLALFKRNDWL